MLIQIRDLIGEDRPIRLLFTCDHTGIFGDLFVKEEKVRFGDIPPLGDIQFHFFEHILLRRQRFKLLVLI